MRLARFAAEGRRCFGVIDGEEAIELVDSFASFEAMIAAAPDLSLSGRRWPLSDIQLLAPVTAGCKVICAANNYSAVEHSALESDPAKKVAGAPEYPQLFIRFADSFVGSGQAVLRAFDAPALDWEGEIGVVMGRYARRVPANAAMDYVAGFTCVAENSERSWQRHSSQVTGGKNWFHSGAIGPWITTVSEAPPPLHVTTRLNGEVVQHATSDDMWFGFADLISYITTFTPLRPGDLIATGTPAGVGFRRTPPRYLGPGNELVVEVSQVGELRNQVQDESFDSCIIEADR